MLELIIENIWLVPVLPLLSFLILGLSTEKFTQKTIGLIGVIPISLSFLITLILLNQVVGRGQAGFSESHALYSWISTDMLSIEIGFLIDHLTLIFLLIITLIGTLIQIYAMGFLSGERIFKRYFVFSNLLFYFLIILVLGNNFFLVLTGWLGCSTSSYFLLSADNQNEIKTEVARTTIIFNRVADCLLLLAVLFIISFFGTLGFESVFRKSVRFISNPGFATTLGLLLTFAVACKAAKTPFHIWTPNATVASLPVVTLILSIVLPVTTIYLVARSHTIFLQAPLAMSILSIVGLFTAFLSASIAIVSTNVKRVLAYISVNQIGFMFLALGVGAFDSAIFHLITQVILMPLFLLSIGNMEYFTRDTEGANLMKKRAPYSYKLFLLGALTLGGLPLLSGFFSRNEILWRTLVSQPFGGFGFWMLSMLISGLTVFVIFRIYYLKFNNPAVVQKKAETVVKPLPQLMSVPSATLSFLAVGVGVLGLPHYSQIQGFLEPVFSNYVKTDLFDLESKMLPLEISFTSITILISLMGFGFAYLLYFVKPEMPAYLSGVMRPLYNFLKHSWYVETLYQNLLIKPVNRVSVWGNSVIDVRMLDSIPGKIQKELEDRSLWLEKLQTGLFRNYLIYFVITLVVILIYLCFSTLK